MVMDGVELLRTLSILHTPYFTLAMKFVHIITQVCYASPAQHFIWITGKVAEVADGVTVKKSPESTEPMPPGAVRIEWPKDADFEEEHTLVWSILM